MGLADDMLEALEQETELEAGLKALEICLRNCCKKLGEDLRRRR